VLWSAIHSQHSVRHMEVPAMLLKIPRKMPCTASTTWSTSQASVHKSLSCLCVIIKMGEADDNENQPMEVADRNGDAAADTAKEASKAVAEPPASDGKEDKDRGKSRSDRDKDRKSSRRSRSRSRDRGGKSSRRSRSRSRDRGGKSRRSRSRSDSRDRRRRRSRCVAGVHQASIRVKPGIVGVCKSIQSIPWLLVPCRSRDRKKTTERRRSRSR
jgi:hypothetical protein